MVQESARHRTQGASGAMLGTQTHVETANQAHLGFLTAGLARLVEMVSKRSSIGTSGRRCSRSPLGGRLATTLVDRYFHHYIFSPPFSSFPSRPFLIEGVL